MVTIIIGTHFGTMMNFEKYFLLVFTFILTNYYGECTTWQNGCGNELNGDKLFSIKLGEFEVSPKNCSIAKGQNFDLSLEFSLAEATQNLTLVCDGRLGIFSKNVLTATRDCHGLRKQTENLKKEKGVVSNSVDLTCAKIHPTTNYIFTSSYNCPSWVPSININIVCTGTNDKTMKTHCINFGCRVHG